MVIPSQTPKEHSEQTYNVSLYTATVLRTGRRSFSRIDVNVTTPHEAGHRYSLLLSAFPASFHLFHLLAQGGILLQEAGNHLVGRFRFSSLGLQLVKDRLGNG